jgi:hypothetical protein
MKINTEDKLVCDCEQPIQEDDLEYTLHCNEEGEEYSKITVTCSSCKKEYEQSAWGQVENKSEALKEFIEQHI